MAGPARRGLLRLRPVAGLRANWLQAVTLPSPSHIGDYPAEPHSGVHSAFPKSLNRSASLRPPFNSRLPRRLPIPPFVLSGRRKHSCPILRIHGQRIQHRPRPPTQGLDDVVPVLRPCRVAANLASP